MTDQRKNRGETKSERRLRIGAIALGIIAVLFLTFGGWFYLSQMQESLKDQSDANILEVTQQGGRSFEIYMDQGNSMLGGRAANFAQYSSSDTKAIGEKLDLYENGDPSFAVIDLTNGKQYFNSGEKVDISESDLKKFQNLSDRGILEPFLSPYNGKRVIGYYEKFKFKDGAEGLVIQTIPVSQMADQFSLSFYDGEGYSYIVNAKGDIVLRSKTDKGNRTFSNIFDVIELDDNTAEETRALRENMTNEQHGVVDLTFDGEDYMFAYVPLPSTDGWYLISLVPNDVIAEHAARMLQTSRLLFVVVAAAALIFITFILVVIQYRRRIRAKETEVLYREQLFDLLANNTNDVFIMVSGDGKTVEYVSPNIERVMGVSTEEVMQDLEHLRAAIHNESQLLDINKVREIPVGESVTFDGGFIHPKTGDQRWFIETVYHTELQSSDRYIAVLADRTEDRNKEAALKEALEIAKVANESKSTFLSNMSHDIRTPMNAIVGLSTLLQRDANDPELVRQHTQKITASSQHLLGLINDVLDMSKIESGKTSLNVGEFNLAELVDELATIMRPQAKAKKQEFEVIVRDIQNEYLIGDKLRINQVMINILSNAVKYTPEGGKIVMTVQQLGQVTQNIARVRFTVADNGVGMSEEYLEHLFQPFTREIRTVVNQIQGTGLGMAITKSLIDLMGGTIEVESELGKGSIFTIDLDVRIQEHEDDPNFWIEHGIQHALIVDDEVDICTEVMSAMANTGVAMQFALDGQTAINMTKSMHQNKDDFDIILLDWKMPGMDGLETARRIREEVPKHIPIMIISAYDYEDIREESVSVGIDGFLSKPFFITNFKEVIRTISVEKDLRDTAPLEGEGSEQKEISLEGRHFLCAEDNELNAAILSELLDMEGATCVLTPDGKEVVEAFAAAPAGTFDAILMDVQMPIMNGYEATREIRELDHEEAKSIPIIALTANAFADDIRDAIEAGMNAHVAKPVDMDKLIDALSALWKS